MYFITLCVQDMECFFGSIQNGQMVLNDAGIKVEKWYFELPHKFPDIELGHYVVMPNHFHAIIINNGTGNPNAPYQKHTKTIVGADLSVRPADENATDLSVRPADENATDLPVRPAYAKPEQIVPDGDILGEHVGSPLRGVVQWFKTMSTNEYIRGVKNQGWPRFRGKLWQRNYYEHIIRSERAFENISGYIENNPEKWEDDRFYRS